jgi:hypothetical protein
MKHAQLIVAVLGAGVAAAKEQPMEKELLSYFHDLAEGEIAASFVWSGRAVMRVTGNLSGRQEIGRYDAMLPVDRLSRLRALKQQSGFDKLPVHPPVPPDTKGVSFGETQDGVHFDHKSWPLYDVPKTIQPVLAELEQLTELIAKHPVRVLRGRGAAKARSFEEDTPVVFQLTFSSVGRETLDVPNPLATRAAARGLRLVVTPDARSGEQEAWIDLAPQDVFPADKAVSRDDRIKLAAGQELIFTVKRKLLAGLGRYRAALVYQTGSPPPNAPEAIQGTLRVDLGSFEVTAPEAR